MHYSGDAPPLRSRPGVGRVHPLTEAYSSSPIMLMVGGEPAGAVFPAHLR